MAGSMLPALLNDFGRGFAATFLFTLYSPSDLNLEVRHDHSRTESNLGS